MCKHVAAVLYGVGVRLDEQPELLFRLRNVDAADLVAQAGAGLTPRQKRPAAGRVLDDAQLADVFGIEIAAGPAPARAGSPRKQAATKPAKKNAARTRAVNESADVMKKTGVGNAVLKRHSKAPALAKPAATPRKTVARTAALTRTPSAVKPAIVGPKKNAVARPAKSRSRKA